MQEPDQGGALTDGARSPELGLIALDPEVRGSVDVLVIDDEHSLRESCASLLRTEGFSVTTCGRGDDALRLVRTRPFDIVLLDLYMTGADGLEIMRATTEAHPETLVIVMTGNPSVESSVNALRAGAWDYLPKPFSATHFQILIGRAAHAVAISRESRRSETARLEPTQSLSDRVTIYGQSAALRRVIELADKVARTDASVFITGESGTGKEVIAHYIHMHSRRQSRELVPLNCAAIPEALLESEMFGHVEGAFTGAVRDKEGLLEVANGGTLFLDELNELPLPTQAKLLRVLQDGAVRRVGSTKTNAIVNVRFIAATNRDPAKAIQEGSLRRDLHYRLRVVPIHIPPLRERTDDIPILAKRFLQELWVHHRERGSAVPILTTEAIETLVRAPWPGNVRELRNVMEHLVVLAEPGMEVSPHDIIFIDDGVAPSGSATTSIDRSLLDLDYHSARESVLASFEVNYLTHVIQAANGNISDAARLADVDRTTLYRLMDKHGIGRDSAPHTPASH
ncbi:MAG: sigma-54-dependent Fis family transcriptional regulator [Gemmatimonadetes bacterium]|nr:sigma-54-dependent Fis family transcriptional regulator [Gemmatimonadota bacterium]